MLCECCTERLALCIDGKAHAGIGQCVHHVGVEGRRCSGRNGACQHDVVAVAVFAQLFLEQLCISGGNRDASAVQLRDRVVILDFQIDAVHLIRQHDPVRRDLGALELFRDHGAGRAGKIAVNGCRDLELLQDQRNIDALAARGNALVRGAVDTVPDKRFFQQNGVIHGGIHGDGSNHQRYSFFSDTADWKFGKFCFHYSILYRKVQWEKYTKK